MTGQNSGPNPDQPSVLVIEGAAIATVDTVGGAMVRIGLAPCSPFSVTADLLGSAPPLQLLAVGGRVVVEGDRLSTVDEVTVADELRRACAQVRP